MKFGVDAPWYQDSAERVAFNLYAMDCERLDEIVENVKRLQYMSIEDIIENYEIKSDYELDYILKRLGW